LDFEIKLLTQFRTIQNIKNERKIKQIKNGLTRENAITMLRLQRRSCFSFQQHRERPYYVYIRELVTFMERTVTIVTKRSAITDIHTHTHTLMHTWEKNTDNRHIIMLT